MLHASGLPCRVRIYEAVPEIKALGVGINLQSHATRELSALGLEPALRRSPSSPSSSCSSRITVSSFSANRSGLRQALPHRTFRSTAANCT